MKELGVWETPDFALARVLALLAGLPASESASWPKEELHKEMNNTRSLITTSNLEDQIVRALEQPLEAR